MRFASSNKIRKEHARAARVVEDEGGQSFNMQAAARARVRALALLNKREIVRRSGGGHLQRKALGGESGGYGGVSDG